MPPEARAQRRPPPTPPFWAWPWWPRSRRWSRPRPARPRCSWRHDRLLEPATAARTARTAAGQAGQAAAGELPPSSQAGAGPVPRGAPVAGTRVAAAGTRVAGAAVPRLSVGEPRLRPAVTRVAGRRAARVAGTRVAGRRVAGPVPGEGRRPQAVPGRGRAVAGWKVPGLAAPAPPPRHRTPTVCGRVSGSQQTPDPRWRRDVPSPSTTRWHRGAGRPTTGRSPRATPSPSAAQWLPGAPSPSTDRPRRAATAGPTRPVSATIVAPTSTTAGTRRVGRAGPRWPVPASTPACWSVWEPCSCFSEDCSSSPPTGVGALPASP